MLDNLINQLYEIGDYEKGLVYLFAHQTQIDSPFVERLLGDSHRLILKNQLDSAWATAMWANHLASQLFGEVCFADTLFALANVYTALEEPEESIEFFDRAAEIYTKHRQENKLVNVYVNKANLYKELNRFQEAFELYSKAKPILLANHKTKEVAIVDLNITGLYEKCGKFEVARKLYAQLRPFFVEQKMETELAGVKVGMAAAYSDLKCYSEALKLLAESLEIFAQANMEVNVAKVKTNAATVYANLSQWERAEQCWETAELIYIKHGMEVSAAGVAQNQALVLKHLMRYEEALDKLYQAESIFDKHRLELERVRVALNKGAIYHLQREYEKAKKTYLRALARAYELEAPEPLLRCHWYLADLFQTHPDLRSACNHYEKAIDQLERISTEIRDEGMMINFFGGRLFLYQKTILLCQRLGKGRKAYEYLERSRSQALLMLLKSTQFLIAKDIPAHHLDKEQKLIAKRKHLASVQATGADLVKIMVQDRHAEEQLSALYEELQARSAFAQEYVAIKRGKPLSFSEVKNYLTT